MVLLRHIQPKVTVPIFKKSKKSALKMVSLLWAAAPQTKTSFQKCSWSNHIALVASPFNPIRPKRYLFFKNGPKMAIFSSTVFALSLLESLCSNVQHTCSQKLYSQLCVQEMLSDLKIL